MSQLQKHSPSVSRLIELVAKRIAAQLHADAQAPTSQRENELDLDNKQQPKLKPKMRHM